MSEDAFYAVEKDPPLARVWLNRPEKKNAMSPPAWTEAPRIFADLDGDDDIRCVILAGKGSCFSTGIDVLAMMAELSEVGSPDQSGGVKRRLLEKIRRLQETTGCIERCRKPVIAAIHGWCIGGALNLAAACDLRLCSTDAVFCLKETALGFVADVGALQRLPGIVGQGATRELAFTARRVRADKAKEMGLVNDLFPDTDALMKGAEDLAAAIAANAPLAVQASKDVLNFQTAVSVEAGLRYVSSISANIIPSRDLEEAVKAFAERRRPDFTGE
jgi:enoyl-CoA hydratase